MRRSVELQEALRVLGERHRAVVAPAGLEASLRAAVRSSERSAGSWIRWRIPAAAAAAVLALLFVRSRQPADAVVPAAVERVSRFVMLPASLGLPLPTATTIFRVELRKSELRQYGIDVPPPVESETVRADFIVGEDGLARAVRLVQ